MRLESDAEARGSVEVARPSALSRFGAVVGAIAVMAMLVRGPGDLHQAWFLAASVPWVLLVAKELRRKVVVDADGVTATWLLERRWAWSDLEGVTALTYDPIRVAPGSSIAERVILHPRQGRKVELFRMARSKGHVRAAVVARAEAAGVPIHRGRLTPQETSGGGVSIAGRAGSAQQGPE